MIIISSKTTESSGRPDAPYEQEQFSGYNLEDLQLEKVLESQCMRRFIQPLWMDWDIPGIDFILRRRATSKRRLPTDHTKSALKGLLLAKTLHVASRQRRKTVTTQYNHWNCCHFQFRLNYCFDCNTNGHFTGSTHRTTWATYAWRY